MPVTSSLCHGVGAWVGAAAAGSARSGGAGCGGADPRAGAGRRYAIDFAGALALRFGFGLVPCVGVPFLGPVVPAGIFLDQNLTALLDHIEIELQLMK